MKTKLLLLALVFASIPAVADPKKAPPGKGAPKVAQKCEISFLHQCQEYLNASEDNLSACVIMAGKLSSGECPTSDRVASCLGSKGLGGGNAHYYKGATELDADQRSCEQEGARWVALAK